MTPDIKAKSGHFRQLLMKESLHADDVRYIRQAASDVWQCDASYYNEVWIPCMLEFPHHFNKGFLWYDGLEEFWEGEHMRHVLFPSACFGLDLFSAFDTLEELLHILADDSLERCVSLNLSEDMIDEEMTHVLTTTPSLRNLEELALATNCITDACLDMLVRSPSMQNVVSLNLYENEITALGIQNLAQSPESARFVSLDFSSNAFFKESARAVAKSAYLGGLLSLDLERCEIEQEGVDALIRSHTLNPAVVDYIKRGRLGEYGEFLKCRVPFDS